MARTTKSSSRARTSAQHGQAYKPFPGASRSDRRQLKQRARRDAEPLRDAYKQGREDERRGRQRSKRRAPASVRRARRQITQPVVAQMTSGLRLLGLTFVVIFIYQLLQSPGIASGALAAPAKALAWLSNPTAGIPKKS